MSSIRIATRFGFAVVLSLAGYGCGGSVFGLDSDGAQSVRIALEAAQGGEIMYASSNDFAVFVSQDGRVSLSLASADTAVADLPLDEEFSTGFNQRFVFLVLDRTAVEEPIALKAWLDGDLRTESVHPIDGDQVRMLYLFGSGISLDDFTVL
jgi:hypothetical protein